MARACGLRIGPRQFELVVLDGSPKAPKVVTTLVGALPHDEEAPLDAAAAALKQAVHDHKVPTENLGVVIEARQGAFRTLALPLTGDDKIEQVLRYEVEGDLPQFNIDDVVVDFHVREATEDSSSLLVTAVPKENVQRAIDLCTAAGFEPLEIELETSALVNAAPAAGLCGLEEAHLLVHVGEESTAVALVDGGKLREYRVIQTGALVHSPRGEATGEAGTEGAESTELAAPAGAPQLVRAPEVTQRILRELARTVSAARTVNDLVGIHVTGYDLPGLIGADVLGVPVQALEGFPVDSSSADVPEEFRSVAVAYGAALRQLGGGLVRARLRRDELEFTGAFERIELPLAVLVLLLTTFLGVWYMFLEKERSAIDRDLRFVLDSSVNYMMGNPKLGKAGNLEYPSEKLEAYIAANTGNAGSAEKPEYRTDPQRNLYEQMVYIRGLLQGQQRDLQKQLGQDSDLVQPQSALKATTLVLDLMAENSKKYGRTSFRSIKADFRGATRAGGSVDSVTVTLELCFFAETSTKATQNFEAFFSDLRSQPWYIDHKSSRSDPITGAESGVYLPNIVINVDVSKAEEVKS